jgi:hypothetical protein
MFCEFQDFYLRIIFEIQLFSISIFIWSRLEGGFPQLQISHEREQWGYPPLKYAFFILFNFSIKGHDST